MTDAAGVAVDIYTYDPHGNSETLTGNPFRYTGRRLDAETGLYYYRARYYSPALGRFLQTDPIGYGDGLNWYAYVGNDPVNGTDPSGEECVSTLVDDSNKAFLCTLDEGQNSTSDLAQQAADQVQPDAPEETRNNLGKKFFRQKIDASIKADQQATRSEQGLDQGSLTLSNGDGTFEQSKTGINPPDGANPGEGLGDPVGDLPKNTVAIVVVPPKVGNPAQKGVAVRRRMGRNVPSFGQVATVTQVPVVVFTTKQGGVFVIFPDRK